jgi:hypothetical protein
LRRLTSSHQTLRSCSDSRVGAFRSLAHADGFSGNIDNSGGRGLLLLVVEDSNGGGLLFGDRGRRGGLLLLLGLGLATSGLGQRARQVAKEAGPLSGLGCFLGLLSCLGRDGSGLERLGRLRDGRGCSVFNLGGSIHLGLRELLSSSWGLRTILGTEKLAEAEVLLLFGGSADGSNRLGLFSGRGWLGDGGLWAGWHNWRSYDCLLKRLRRLGLDLLYGGSSETSLMLLLLRGRRLELLNEVTEDAATLSGLGLLLDDGSDSFLGLGEFLNWSRDNGDTSLRLGLLGRVDDLAGVDRSSGGDYTMLVRN